MGFWKQSETFGITYHMMRTPDAHFYVSGDPVSSGIAGIAEVSAKVSIDRSHQSVLDDIWRKGILPLEPRIMQYLGRPAQILLNDFYIRNPHRNHGVLIVVTVFEQGDEFVYRIYESTHIENAYSNYEAAYKDWSTKDRLIPRKKKFRTAFYHIWAVRN